MYSILRDLWKWRYPLFYNKKTKKKVPTVHDVNDFEKSISQIKEYIKATNFEDRYNLKVHFHVDATQKRFSIQLEPLWTKKLIERYQPGTIFSDETFAVFSAGYSLSVVRIRTNGTSACVLMTITNFCDESFFKLNLGLVLDLIPSAVYLMADCALAPRAFINEANRTNQFGRVLKYRAIVC